MGVAHNGEDDIAFFAADIGRTFLLPVTTSFAWMDPKEGALPWGRYLVQLLSAPSGERCWVHFSAFSKPLDAPENPIGAGAQRIPMMLGGVVAFETNALAKYSDRVGAVLTSGSGILAITQVSRQG